MSDDYTIRRDCWLIGENRIWWKMPGSNKILAKIPVDITIPGKRDGAVIKYDNLGAFFDAFKPNKQITFNLLEIHFDYGRDWHYSQATFIFFRIKTGKTYQLTLEIPICLYDLISHVSLRQSLIILEKCTIHKRIDFRLQLLDWPEVMGGRFDYDSLQSFRSAKLLTRFYHQRETVWRGHKIKYPNHAAYIADRNSKNPPQKSKNQ